MEFFSTYLSAFLVFLCFFTNKQLQFPTLLLMFSLMNSRLICVFQKCLNCSLGFISLKPLFAFACNLLVTEKPLQLPFNFFLIFLSSFLDRLPKVFFRNVLSFVIQEPCDQDRTYFIGHTGISFLENFIRDACGI